jgi:protein-S-isoprenylcysteine O-methyltransferase Ste14
MDLLLTVFSGESDMNMVLFCILWVSWCGVHSFLIDSSVLGYITKCTPRLAHYHRLLYNGLSLLTLVPLVVLTRNGTGKVIFAWEGYSILVRGLLFVAALLLFHGGAKRYDFQHFIGLKQLRSGQNHILMSDNEEFSDSGVFGLCRHPWYLGSLLLIWSILPEYPLPHFLAACILSVYLVVGSFLEERKIVAQYGVRYRDYQQRVSMFFPWKWLKRKFDNSN